jgi:recombination associated protein RdgC
MWFKNLIAYRLPADWAVSARELEEKLQLRSLMPCGAFDMQSRGWVFSSDAERYVHTVNGQHLIALGVDQKLLPGSIIRQVATERAKEMAKEQGYPVGRRQMRELKMRVTEELRGRALTRKRITYAWIDPSNGWLVVDAAGEARAEELVETLRDTLGSLQVTLLETERSPSASMTAWLMLGDAPLTFTIDDDLELQAGDQSKPTIRYVRHPLDGKEIRAQINAGMFATRMGLTWKDRVAFVLNEKLHVKRLEFLLIDKDDKPDEGSSTNPGEQFDIDFTLMAGELAALLTDLAAVLGAQPEQQAAA